MNAGRYGYLVVVLALLAAYLRIRRARRIAEAHIAQRQSPYSVTARKVAAGLLFGFAGVLGVFAAMHRHRPWPWLACAVAALSGCQALATATLELVS